MRIWIAAAAAAAFWTSGIQVFAGDADSTAVIASERNVMLNAEAATVPRELNIGLPTSGNGAVVFVDGMKAAQGLPRSYCHWAGGNSYNKTTTYSLMESVIRTGEIGAPVDSWTKLGGDRFEGVVTARTSTHGLIRLDAWTGGPIKKLKGWYYSAGAYVNYDPTAVNSPSVPFIDRKQIYQLNLSRRWKSSELDFLYRYSWCGDEIDGLFNTAPFVYNGDGSVSVFGGFRMGYDCYFPAEDDVTYMDLATGQMRNITLGKFNDRRFHDISVLWKHRTESGWKLGFSTHLLLMPRYNQIKGALAGADYVTADKGFTLSDGTPFEGYIQNRMIKAEYLSTYDSELLLQVEKKHTRGQFTAGLSITGADQHEHASSFILAHTATASPERIYYSGKNAWNLNRNALYFEAKKFTTAFFVFDKFKLGKRFDMLTGLRLKPLFSVIHTAARLNGETKNRRVDGFNLADPALADVHVLNHNGVDYAVSESLNCKISNGLSAIAEGFYSMTTKSTTYFKNATIPSLKAIGNAHARAGITYVNSWLSMAGVVSYITSWNNAANLSVTKQIGGISETIPWVAQYGIGTPGATIDANIFTGGFKCHLMFTWQDPRYHNYTNVFTFSDGSTQTIDYTGKQCTGISKMMAEIDPSYKWKSWRVWASARYYSRQFASRTNYAYFNGRIETFGGVDWDYRDNLKVSLSFVNLLGQGGVKGSIDIADTIDDESALAGYVMAGTFIRPFSVDLSVTYKF